MIDTDTIALIVQEILVMLWLASNPPNLTSPYKSSLNIDRV